MEFIEKFLAFFELIYIPNYSHLWFLALKLQEAFERQEDLNDKCKYLEERNEELVLEKEEIIKVGK